MSQALQATSFLTREKIDLIKNLYCKKANDTELKLFLDVCESRKLDPVLKQIHAVFRWSKKDNAYSMSIQVGIDGFRLMASRTGEYAGSDAIEFEWSDDNGFPVKATATVYRMVQGQKCAFTGEAYWDEYYPGDGPEGFFWKKMPKGQLAKCAETIALRKGFPGETSGLYEPAEMNQAGFTTPETDVPRETKEMATTEEKDFETALVPFEEEKKIVSTSLESIKERIDAKFFAAKKNPKSSLADTVIHSGKFAGCKLSQFPKGDWKLYREDIEKNLLSSDFPVEMREPAQAIAQLIKDYLKE